MCKFNHIRFRCAGCSKIVVWRILEGEMKGKIYEIKNCANPADVYLESPPKLFGNLTETYPPGCVNCLEDRIDETTNGTCAYVIEVRSVGFDPKTMGIKPEAF
ncbi:hypothetical protein QBC44DRAFT_367317 [Cladorrhinum sp. PSN332]|nr:hypothetical protein QBC44DRAFT_367317 [Cladorrhinum sp. PSN332]